MRPGRALLTQMLVTNGDDTCGIQIQVCGLGSSYWKCIFFLSSESSISIHVKSLFW